MSRPTRRRRIVAATIVSGVLLIVGPAAYGVAAAKSRVEDPVTSVTQSLTGSDGNGNGDDGNGGDGNGDGGDSGKNDKNSGDKNSGKKSGQADPSEGEDASGKKGDDDGKKDSSNGLDVLATDCSGSKLAPHDGFQKAPRCVSTAFGEVAAQAKSPSLLITDAPTKVAPGQSFQLKVSTRNLVRDRFLAAAKGGYYKESSLLNAQGLQRGHFHTACRILPNTDEAPDAAPEPAFFLATEDGSGSATPDTTTIQVPGQQAGELQCASWAGDGSHRIPMMQRADQTPAFDSVRITVG